MRPLLGAVAMLLLVACIGDVRDGVPILVVNEDDEVATVELRTYDARTGEERVVAEPVELAPGETYAFRMEPTFDPEPSLQLLLNDYIALTSAFACDLPPPEGPEDLPASVRIIVNLKGEPVTCPFTEI